MKKFCTNCGAEYGDHAEYCNACGQESLVPLVEATPKLKKERLIADGHTLAYVTAAWLLGTGYIIGEVRPRSWVALFLGWAFLTLVTGVFSIAMQNVRTAAFMSAVGVSFFVIYGLLFL